MHTSRKSSNSEMVEEGGLKKQSSKRAIIRIFALVVRDRSGVGPLRSTFLLVEHSQEDLMSLIRSIDP